MKSRIRRSLIEVAAHDERALHEAKAWEPDVLMLDLEDAVPARDEDKAAARLGAASMFEQKEYRAREAAIRVNRPGSPWFLEDARLAVEAGFELVIIPKVYSADEVVFAEQYFDRLEARDTLTLMLIVETPGLLLDLATIAAKCRRVDGLIGGSSDYTLETGSFAFAAPTGSQLDDIHLMYNRQHVLAVARANGWSALDGLLLRDVENLDKARETASRARYLGFDGCSMFYPPHIGIVNEVFAPTVAELDWAAQVVKAYRAIHEGGPPALYHGGRAVDRFHYELALHVREKAAALGIDPEGSIVEQH